MNFCAKPFTYQNSNFLLKVMGIWKALNLWFLYYFYRKMSAMRFPFVETTARGKFWHSQLSSSSSNFQWVGSLFTRSGLKYLQQAFGPSVPVVLYFICSLWGLSICTVYKMNSVVSTFRNFVQYRFFFSSFVSFLVFSLSECISSFALWISFQWL